MCVCADVRRRLCVRQGEGRCGCGCVRMRLCVREGEGGGVRVSGSGSCVCVGGGCGVFVEGRMCECVFLRVLQEKEAYIEISSYLIIYQYREIFTQ